MVLPTKSVRWVLMSIGSVFHHNIFKLCQGDTSIAVLLSKPWAAVVGMNGTQVGCWSGSTQTSRKATATPWGTCAYIPPLTSSGRRIRRRNEARRVACQSEAKGHGFDS